MRIGDHVRLRAGSGYVDLLGDYAQAVGRVTGTEQVDDDGLAIAVTYADPEGYTSALPAGEFEAVEGS